VKHRLFKLMNLWPPFLGAGIRLERLAKDLRTLEVSLKLGVTNRNIMGTHYGGSLYSMTDPFYMFLVMEALGKDFVVWDKAAAIRFRKPGRGRVTARFTLTDAKLAEIRAEVAASGRSEPVFVVEVKDESGDVVAVVEKKLSVKPKAKAKEKGAP
jgi:hypothetical protein